MLNFIFLKKSLRKVAITGVTSLALGTAGIAHAQLSRFIEKTQIQTNGEINTQIANTSTFPTFRGEDQGQRKLTLNNINNQSARAIRMLIAYDADKEYRFNIDAGMNDTLSGIISPRKSKIYIEYQGASTSSEPPSLATLLKVEKTPNVRGYKKWTFVAPLDFSLPNTHHMLVTAYVLPYTSNSVLRQNTNLVLTMNDAMVHDNTIVAGPALSPPFGLKIGAPSLEQWSSSAATIGAGLGGNENRSVAFAEQRTVALQNHTEFANRKKRCIEDWLQSAYSLGGWALARLFGTPSACESAPPLPQNTQIVVTDAPSAPSRIDLTVYEALEVASGSQADFDLAMSIAFCNDASSTPEAPPQACAANDRNAIREIGELSPNTIRTLLAQINTYNSAAQSAPLHLSTGRASLDAWLNQNIDRATNALNAAVSINNVSDTQQQPNEPSHLRYRKANLVKASCANNRPDQGENDEGWQCVSKAKQTLKINEPRIAITPLVQIGGRYALSGTPEFDTLTQQLLRSGRSLPPGIRPNEFAVLTYGIAHDGAPTGHNLGLVYLNNPATPRSNRRFAYGLAHIWAPGSGGGNNAGHRDDWMRLEGFAVDSPAVLGRVIMAALTDTGARFQQTRESNGNIVRTYQRFTYRNNLLWYEFSNIRIVLGQNGMVITAYPLKEGKAQRIQVEM